MILRTPRTTRLGVTLVEMLVTITILAILGSAILFASYAANESARAAATRAKIASLHSLVTEKYDEYRTRRVEVQSRQPDWKIVTANRLAALRVMMRMEMPDRWSDIVLEPVENRPPTQTGNLTGYRDRYPPQPSGVTRSSLSWAYLRRYDSLKSTDPEVIQANQGAECLYMIVTLATGDGEALALFRQSDIGDVDGDGAPEFLDAWGNPIHYLLAAPGFTELSDLQTADPVNNHDPFDVYRIDPVAYRLAPLIYSAGADGNSDIATRKDVHPLADLKYYAGPASTIGLPLSDTSDDQFANEDDGENWIDNIHNHDLSVR